MCHNIEFTADFLEDPVPTTSPTNTNWEPSDLNLFNSSNGFSIFSENFKKACACKGMSGLDQASFAGEKSSVFVSPLTLYIVSSISLSKVGLFSNHSAFAHDSRIDLAWELFLLSSKISLKESYTRIVFLSASAASAANLPFFNTSTNASTE